jgi:hypothetical protein
MGDAIELREAIATLRQELDAARSVGAGERVQFAVGTIDLEFTVQVGREGGAGAKVRFWVVEAGAEGKLSSSSTQVVKIRLEPVDTVTKAQVLVAETEGPSGDASEPKPSPAVG